MKVQEGTTSHISTGHWVSEDLKEDIVQWMQAVDNTEMRRWDTRDQAAAVMHLILQHQGERAVQHLLQHLQLDLEYEEAPGQGRLLYQAVCRGMEHVASLLLAAGASVRASTHSGCTALHAAADHGHAFLIRLLVSHNANVDERNRMGDTALHLAAMRGHTECVQVLLALNADPTALNVRRKSPLTEATVQRHSQTAVCLQAFIKRSRHSSKRPAV